MIPSDRPEGYGSTRVGSFRVRNREHRSYRRIRIIRIRTMT